MIDSHLGMMEIDFLKNKGNLESLVAEKGKQSLLLHACCAPCSSSVIETLLPFFHITVFFFNPNIYPREEFFRRLSELEIFLPRAFPEVKLIAAGENFHDNEIFAEKNTGYNVSFNEILGKFSEEREGGKRCENCFYSRMMPTALLAERAKFPFWTTTLSVSPHKNADLINRIGMEIQNAAGFGETTRFLPANFKKNDGFKRSLELSREYGLYRQNYCGCLFSKRKAEDRSKNERPATEASSYRLC
ncbi:MAG: epoxyqueuosine reductase QueH [Spirochaetaceae bacterium]|nr:epoxyqueuosine reductase QueH [Spirochaetaceae bacterium]